VEAAKAVLAEEGFQSFGVNAIARRAGCDKQLIYRYFKGLEGLADAIGADLAEKLAEELEPLSMAGKPTAYGQLMEILVLGFLDRLRGDRIMQQIIAWELAAPSPLVARMVAARGQRLGAWMHAMRGGLVPPDGVDAAAINAILIAGTEHLVLSAAATGAFTSVPLQTDADWARVSDALKSLVAAVYGGPKDRA
jgi:AcrR family transcriptional regulator